jgi:hypothetical protein
MKDRLEKYVIEHRDEFDMLEPNDALWQGIEKKMKKEKNYTLRFYTSRVAAVAAIFIISFMVQKFFFNQNNIYKEIPELAEAESYYSGIINAKLEEVKPMLNEFPDIQQELDYDLSELDSVYKGLREDLKDNVANQEVIEAMIENYRIRIDLLEEMMHFLDRQDEDNNEHNNTSEYEL